MQFGHRQWSLAHVDAGDIGAALGHGLGQDAAATADIHQAFAGDRRMFVDVVGAQRVDVVQRFEFTAAIPPARGQRLEFGDFLRVYIHVAAHGYGSPVLLMRCLPAIVRAWPGRQVDARESRCP